MKVVNSLFVSCIVVLISGCLSVGSLGLKLDDNVSFEQYDQIKRIVVEEAASNGFSTFTSEIVPTEYNNWKGHWYRSHEDSSSLRQCGLYKEKKGSS